MLAPLLAPVAVLSPVDDLADDRIAGNELGAGEFDDQIDDQADTARASFVPLADDLADAIDAGYESVADDQAVSYEASDDQAKAAGASYEPLADNLVVSRYKRETTG